MEIPSLTRLREAATQAQQPPFGDPLGPFKPKRAEAHGELAAVQVCFLLRSPKASLVHQKPPQQRANMRSSPSQTEVWVSLGVSGSNHNHSLTSTGGVPCTGHASTHTHTTVRHTSRSRLLLLCPDTHNTEIGPQEKLDPVFCLNSTDFEACSCLATIELECVSAH